MSYQFTGDTLGTIKQWKIPKVTNDDTSVNLAHEINDGHFCDVRSMTTTGNNLFTSDIKGNLKQWTIAGNTVLLKEWEKPHDLILSIDATEDGQFLFTSDGYGNLKQFDIASGELTYDYEKVHDSAIRKIKATKDSKYLFTADDKGNIKQWLIEAYSLVRDFGKAHQHEIRSIIPTSDNKFLFSIDKIGNLKQWFVKDTTENDEIDDEPAPSKSEVDFEEMASQKHITLKDNVGHDFDPEVQKIRDDLEYKKNLKKDFGKIQLANVNSLALTPDDKYQFTADYYGVIRQWKIGNEKKETRMIKDFGKVQDCILALVCSKDSKYQLSADDEGCIIQWDIEQSKKMKKYKGLHKESICSMVMN